MKIIDCGGQRTAAWFDQHLGKLTSSRIEDAVNKRKRNPKDPLQAYLDLLLELAVERVTNKPAEHFVSIWMERGLELEPLARAAYELRTGKTIALVDFVAHPELQWAGCSPDGVCGDELIEIKVPKPTTHAKYILNECVPKEYVAQMTWQLACCPECKVNTFISYCPDFPDPLDLFICRLHRNGELIAAMEAEATVFLKSVDDLTLRLGHGLEGALQASVDRLVPPKAVIPPWNGKESLADA